ncbi:MAG TPA: hypothetical protein VNQ77_07325 [Frankiaceae bacterium]|nr:hypothetical protein [Frankiaceae bacterium]
MRLRLLAAGLAAAASLAVPAAADPLYFERECSGPVDAACYHDFCGIYDCIRSDCLAYTGLLGEGNAGLCVGKARPRDPIS